MCIKTNVITYNASSLINSDGNNISLETNWTDFFLFSSFFCPSKTDICFNSQTLLTQTLRGTQKVSVVTGVCNKQIKFRETGRVREASNAGVFSGAFVWEGQNMSSPKNTCVGD